MAAEKLPYIQFYPKDWLQDQVSSCSLAAQGLWLRMMFIGHGSDRYGYLSIDGKAIPQETLAKMCGVSLGEFLSLMTELDALRIPERTPDGIIYSRRMSRDAQRRKDAVRNGRKGGNPQLLFRETSEDDNRSLKTVVNPPDILPLKMKLKSGNEIEIPEKLRSEKFARAFAEWIEHRAEIKHPLTALAAKKQLSQLSEWGEARAIAALDHSISAGWQGIFEPKNNTEQIRSNGQYGGKRSRVDEQMNVIDRALEAK